MDLNPLGDVLEKLFDFERLRRDCPIQLHIAATRVSTGRLEVFRESALSVDHLLASACLPTVFKAVEIDDEAYWDGGFAVNPPVAALLEHGKARDLLMVLLNPLGRDEVPSDAEAIQHRVKEFTFGAGFLRELAAIARQRVKSEQQGYAQDDEQRRLRDTHFHMIAAEDSVKGLDPRSRYNAHRELLEDLHKEGRRHAGDWLETCGSGLGKHSTVDLAARFL
jgi:NTE family protein